MLLFADSFGQYGATADFTKKWASNSAPSFITLNNSSPFPDSGKCITLGSGAGILASQTVNAGVLATANSKAFFAFWFKGTTTVQALFLKFGSIGLPQASYVGVSAAGLIGYLNNTSLVTSNVNVCDGQIHWIEVQYSLPVSGASAAAIYVDGLLAITSTPLNGTGVPLQSFSLNSTASATINIGNFIVWDDQAGLQTGELTTSSIPIGPRRSRLVLPTGVGSNTNWALGAGSSNWAATADAPYSDWDSSYVDASSSGVRDSYAKATIPSTDTNPSIVVVNTVAKNADAGAINIQGLVYNGGQYGLGDSKAAGSSYTTQQFPIYRDPATGLPWTTAGLNTAEIGVGVV